jgi:hypothetical protein
MAKFQTPDLRNATMSHLLDEAARYRAIEAEASFYNKFYSTAIKARMNGKDNWPGENHIALLTVSYADRISADLCRQILDEATLAKVTVQGEVITLRIVKRFKDSVIDADEPDNSTSKNNSTNLSNAIDESTNEVGVA